MKTINHFDISRIQSITDSLLSMQSKGEFEQAAALYRSVITEIESQDFFMENDSEWIENLLIDETRTIIINS